MTHQSVFMRKRAGIGNDMVASTLNFPATPIGAIAGFFRKPPTEKEMLEREKHPGKSYIPGVAGFRLAQARTGLSKKHGGKRGKAASEFFGPITSTLLAGAAGGLAGGLLGGGLFGALGAAQAPKGYKLPAGLAVGAAGATQGATIGAGVGVTAATAAHIIAGIIAGARRKRTDEEQGKYEKSKGATVMNYMMPGWSTYNTVKSWERMHQDEGNRVEDVAAYEQDKKDARQQRKQEKKDAKAAKKAEKKN